VRGFVGTRLTEQRGRGSKEKRKGGNEDHAGRAQYAIAAEGGKKRGKKKTFQRKKKKKKKRKKGSAALIKPEVTQDVHTERGGKCLKKRGGRNAHGSKAEKPERTEKKSSLEKKKKKEGQ